MTKKAKKPPKAIPKPIPKIPPIRSAAAALFFAPRRKWLWVTLAAAATGFGLHAGVQELREVTGRLPENRLRRSMLHVTPKPSWVTIDLAEKILADAGFDLAAAKLTDPDLLSSLAAAFEQSPWVKSVRIRAGVRTLTVDAVYRKPVLSIPWKDWACYVSADGVVLPPDPETDKQAFRQCLVLEGASESAPPHVGQRFTDSNVLASAKLADAIGELVESLNLVSISATDAGMTLTTKGGSKIEWGSSVGDAEELRRKIALLETASDEKHQLDGPGSPLHYDLTADVRSLVGQPLKGSR